MGSELLTFLLIAYSLAFLAGLITVIFTGSSESRKTHEAD